MNHRYGHAKGRWLRRVYLVSCVLLAGGLLCGAGPAQACAKDNHVEGKYLFSDQGSLYDSAPEPTASQSVTLTLRTCRNDITGATIEYWDAADPTPHSIAMHPAAPDPTGIFDYWRGVIPAGASEKRYRFQISDGSATVWLNAAGVSSREPSSGPMPESRGASCWMRRSSRPPLRPTRSAPESATYPRIERRAESSPRRRPASI